MTDLYHGRRTFWLWLQHGTGLLNAYAVVSHIAGGSYGVAAISALAMLVTAKWKLPPAAGKDR